ncbi:MAG: hypothetical protein KDN22_09915 [Verrucomicrobiae bacterium]|nr:hypothetical protein [Verrucomicrobiae bacterium]
MKSILFAILLGLPVGWFLSHAISPANKRQRSAVPPSMQLTERHPAGIRVDQQRAGTRAGRVFSPYRDQVESLDLIQSLSPEQLTDVIQSGQLRKDHELDAAFQSLALADSGEALRLADEIVDTNTLDRIQSVVINTCVTSDPEPLLIHLQSVSDSRARIDLVKQTAEAWAVHDPIAALNHLRILQEILGNDDLGMVSDILERCSQGNFDTAEEWVLNECPTGLREDLHRGLLSARLRWGGEEAVNFILKRGDAASREFLRKAFLSWAQYEPEGALDRFAKLQNEPELQDAPEMMGKAAVEGLIRGSHKVSILTLQERLPEGEQRWKFLLGAVKGSVKANSRQHPDLAREIVTAMPESYERDQAMAHIAETWLKTDPAVLGDWLRAIAPSASRDVALSKIAGIVAKTDRGKAREWAALITNDNIRKRLVEKWAD